MEIYWKKIKKPLKKNKLFNLLTTPYYAPATPTPFLLWGGGGVEPLEGGAGGLQFFDKK